MRKNVFGRQFSRTANQRKSLFKSLLTALIMDESIETTLEKAKAIKADADKIISKAKKGNEKTAIQLLQRTLGEDAVNKVVKDLAKRFKDRNSGYTRIIKLGRRFSDNASTAIIEWVVKKEIKEEKSEAKSSANKELPAGKQSKSKLNSKKSEKEIKKEKKQ